METKEKVRLKVCGLKQDSVGSDFFSLLAYGICIIGHCVTAIIWMGILDQFLLAFVISAVDIYHQPENKCSLYCEWDKLSLSMLS